MIDMLLAQSDPAVTAAKAAADLLNAQDVLTMWKSISTIACAGAGFFAWQWYRCIQADIARLNKIVETYTSASTAQKAAA